MIAPVTLSLSGLISVAESLILILFLLVVSVFILKKLSGTRLRPPFLAPSSIQVIASRSLGWQSSIMIVEAQGTRFLISTGRGGVTAIGVLNIAPTVGSGDLK